VIFGSTARGQAGAHSDLDIGVSGPRPEDLNRIQVCLARASGRCVDLIDLDRAPPLLRFEVARDGHLLLEREPHLWSDFKARAMIDWWDWAPTARRLQARAAERLRRQVHGGTT
jgi:predicted nucleotidyltransferase